MATAKGLMDDEPLQFDCPECGQSVNTTDGASRRNGAVECGGGHTIEMIGDDLDRKLRSVEKSIDGLFKGFQ